MYTKQEASAIRQQFWTSFGLYMSPVPSASGEKISWINYKTGVKGIRFKMGAENKYAAVAVEIRAEEEKRLAIYHMFKSFEDQFPDYFEWIEHCDDEYGKPLSRIYCEQQGLTIFDQEHWPEIISFLKKHIIFLDAFWWDNKDIFDMMF